MARRDRGPLGAEEKRKLNKENLSKLTRIFSFVIPYKTYFILGMLCLLFSSLTLMGFPFITGKLLDAASGKDEWVVQGLNNIAFILIGILAIQSFFSFFRVYFFAQVSERGLADVRKTLYHKFMDLPMTFYDNRRTGELVSRITSDVALLQDTFSVTLAEFIRQILTLLVGIVFIVYTTPALSLFMLGTFPFIIVGAMVFGTYIRKLSKKTQDELAATNIVVEETLQSVSMVKAFTNEKYETGRYATALTLVVKTALKTATFRAAFISFIIFALFGGIVAIMWYGARLVSTGEMTVGDLLSFVLYTTFIGGSIAGLGDLYGQIQKAIGASERMIEILDEDDEKPEQGIRIHDGIVRGNISFKHVKFRYPTRQDVEVLKDLSFEIKSGQKVALVGPSGAGKSTIVQLLMRFYPLNEGSISLDGQGVHQFSLDTYRSQIGIVPQEVILFGGSIKENIAYGKPNASEQEILDAAQRANALDFILGFPDGLETIVGERGVKLSGGQRQRVAIARALLKNPRILILDEATSSLDAESEHVVQEALEELMKGRTTLIIAHRLATIRKADNILVLEKGQIVESGTHEELVRKEGGLYQNLVRLQFQEV